MATTNNITTTYAGEARKKFISAAILSSPTIFNGGVTLRPNVKYKEVLQKIEVTDLIKDASCDFDPTATVTHTEQILEPKELQVNLQLCKKDYHSSWEAVSQGYGAHDNLPPDFQSYLVGLVAAKVAAANETAIWQGAAATAGSFAGFETLLTAQAAQPAAQEIASTTLSASNIVAQTQLVMDQITSQVYGADDLMIYMNQKSAKFYVAAMAALGYLDKYHVDKAPLNFQGVPIFVAPGMSDDTMIAAERSNLFFGTGILSDMNEVEVIDTAATLGDQNVRVVMRFTAGVQIGNAEDIVTYGITNGSN